MVSLRGLYLLSHLLPPHSSGRDASHQNSLLMLLSKGDKGQFLWGMTLQQCQSPLYALGGAENLPS